MRTFRTYATARTYPLSAPSRAPKPKNPQVSQSRIRKSTDHVLTQAVLAKLRKRESMSRDEVDYATELISDSRSLLAYSIPAALFTMGCFYIVGCLEELHGGTPSVRTFIGVIPMLTSTNLTIQLLRVARLKGRLQDVSLTVPHASDVVTTA